MALIVITTCRPGIPESYGIETSDAGMLDWADVSGTLASSRLFWVSTVAPTGAPHLIPIWGAWVDDAAYIEGGDDTRWARNLAQGDGRVHLGVDHGGTQVIVRGTASQVDLPGDLQREVADAYDSRYPYRPEGTRFTRITPSQVLAWRTDTVEAFASTPTQFDFGGSHEGR
jgi:hypothetical protein